MSVVIKGDSNINLDFTTGGRITGDFSNATIANRVAFQTSTTNGATSVQIISNGTGNYSDITVNSSSDLSGGSVGLLAANGSTEVRLVSTRRGTDSFVPLTFYTSGSERMRIDTAGQLGVGITPLSTQGNLQVYKNISGGSPATSGTTDANQVFAVNYASVQTSFGAYANGNAWIQQRAGGNFAVNYDLVLQPNGGNLGIGVAAPARKLDVAGGRVGFTPNSEPYAVLLRYNTSTNGVWIGSPAANAFGVFNEGGGEYMRVDGSGNLLVGKTSASSTTQGVQLAPAGGVSIFTRNGGAGCVFVGNSNQNVVEFNYSSTTVGSISIGPSSTAFNTSSDYRLKNTIAPMTGALTKVALLKPVTYKWNADNSDGQGFIAHELAEVVPDAVTGAKDAVDADGKPVYQGIDTSFLVATLTAAIQEQQAMIEQLKADVAALKGTV